MNRQRHESRTCIPIRGRSPSFALACKRGLRGCITLVALVVALPAFGAGRFVFETTPGRLPKDVVPVHYQLAFDVDPARDTFDGRVEIDVDVQRPVEAIILNAQGLRPLGAQLRDAQGGVRKLSVLADDEHMQWRLKPEPGAAETTTPDAAPPASVERAAGITAGRYQLRLEYQGEVQRSGQGLYRVDYTALGKPAQMLATQLEPAHARKLFPAFDEPAFRATFEVTATIAARYEAVSNMPRAAEAMLADGRKRVQFARTPSMPTYLVALAVGSFDAVESSFDGVPLRILTARGKREQGQYAMDATKRLLAYYRDYFGIAYMLPKLDQIAVPGVRNGAMEDWGAISYNENTLLYDPKRSGPRQQQRVFSIVAHEIAHQWFGDLVTTAWWDDIWLNEAFATWMASKASNELNPGWRVRLHHRLHREKAMARDASDATRAISEPPKHERAIFDVFDDITYDKGGTVLDMFEHYLTADVFRDGVRRYLSAHRYSNATAADLWFHFSQAAGRDVTAMIGTWIDQPGVPLLSVKAHCEKGRNRIEIAQQRFAAATATVPPTTWDVPVVLHAGASTRETMLGREPQRLELAGCAPVVANGGDLGYYRVQYDQAGYAELRKAFATLPPAERIGLVADTLALVRAGRTGVVEYLGLLGQLRNEREPEIWLLVLEQLEYLDETFASTPTQARLRTYAGHLLAPVLTRLDWKPRPKDDPSTLRLRDALIDALGRFDHRATIEHARKLVAVEKAGGKSAKAPLIPPSIRPGVIAAAARRADAAAFERLRTELRQSADQEENYMYGHALIGVRDPKLVQRVLQLTLSDEWPPTSAAYYAGHIGLESGQNELARAFVVRNFDRLAGKASDWSRMWLLPDTYEGFADVRRADELIVEQQRRLGDYAAGPAAQVAALIRERAGVRTRHGAALDAWLRARLGPSRVSAKQLAATR